MNGLKPVFWSRWIIFLSLFLIIYGLSMVIAPRMMNTTLVVPILYSRADFQDAFTSMVEPELTFFNMLNALMGAITVSWAVQIAWTAHKPFRSGETWAWNAIGMGALIWAVLEFYIKLTSGIRGIGLIAHFSLLIAFAIPLIFTYRYFHPAAVMTSRD